MKNQMRNADGIKGLNQMRKGVGYGTLAVGTLGAGAAGLAGINALRGSGQPDSTAY